MTIVHVVTGGGGGGSHDHMGTGVDSTIAYGLTDSTPPLAGGNSAVAMGQGATATSDYSVAIGGAYVTGVRAVAIGSSSQASGSDSIAFGYKALSQGLSSIAIGSFDGGALGGSGSANRTWADGDYGIALGYWAFARNYGATAIGTGAHVTEDYGTAVGFEATIGSGNANAFGGAAFGVGAAVYQGETGLALGWNAAIGYYGSPHDYSTAIGYVARSTNSNQVFIGTVAGGVPRQNIVQTLQSSAPADADIPTNFMCFYLDESSNSLKVRVRYAGGTYKSGTVTLT